MLVVSAIVLVVGPFLLAALAKRARLVSHQSMPAGAALDARGRWMLGALILAALTIRMMRINESLWYDEIASWMSYNGAVRSWGAVMGSFLEGVINHTLHTLLNRWSVEWLSAHASVEMAFRVPALVFSLVTVPIMLGLGRAAMTEAADPLRSSRVGLLAATLAAVGAVCVLEGVEARGYVMMMFFSAAATWAFIAAFRAGNRPACWTAYALLATLGVWSHIVTAWIFIGHATWLIWRMATRLPDRNRCSQGIVALIMAGVFSISLHAPQIPALLAWRSNFKATRPDQPRLVSDEGLHALLQLGGAWYWWAALPGLLLFALGLWTIATRRTSPAGAHPRVSPCDALVLSLFGLGLMVLAIALTGSWVYARYMLFAMPGALLAMACGIDAIWVRSAAGGMIALAVIAAGSIADLAMRPPKQPLRQAMDFIGHRLNPGDHAVEVGVAHPVMLMYRPEGLSLSISYLHGQDLADRLDATAPRWVIIEYPLKVNPATYELLEERDYSEVARFRGWVDWRHGEVLVLERSSAKQR
jgi:hypothetical protein